MINYLLSLQIVAVGQCVWITDVKLLPQSDHDGASHILGCFSSTSSTDMEVQ